MRRKGLYYKRHYWRSTRIGMLLLFMLQPQFRRCTRPFDFVLNDAASRQCNRHRGSMPRRPRPGKCVHCLRFFELLTWDHIIPVSWYPDSTPQNMAKWKIPSCCDCNNTYGRLEEDLLWRLGLCVDSRNALASGIPERVKRSIYPKFAKDPREKRVRQKKIERIVQQIELTPMLPDGGIFPNFGPKDGIKYIGYPIVRISEQDMTRFGIKLVRGVTYQLDRRFIEDDYEIEVYFPDDSQFEQVLQIVGKYLETHERGPGVRIRRAVPVEDPKRAIFEFRIWGQLRIAAIVAPKE